MTHKLLLDARFKGLFWTQFLGAMNDNFFKNALVILTLYRLAGESGPLLVTVAAGIFILPFFLFSATAGQIADKFDKARVTRLVKIAEIVIMAAGAVALLLGDIAMLLAVLFAMGTQSDRVRPDQIRHPARTGRPRTADGCQRADRGRHVPGHPVRHHPRRRADPHRLRHRHRHCRHAGHGRARLPRQPRRPGFRRRPMPACASTPISSARRWPLCAISGRTAVCA